jgi:23S rRNA (cytosine1962-C5)-methyltransferase
MTGDTELLDEVRALPGPSDRRIAVRTTPDALRQLRGGNPWLFDGSITSASDDGASPGDLAVVFDADRKFAAIGLWDPGSPLRVKVLHVGDPATIDADWWSQRVATAVERRSTLDDDPDTTGYRIIHGENDGFGGLVVDRYAGTLVVKLYSEIWYPHLAPVLDALVDQLAPRRVVLRLSRGTGPAGGLIDGRTLYGPDPDGPVRFKERGLTFEADVVRGHKTGHFLDQRDNRGLVRGMSAGAKVLDVFASTGGFSVAAAAGGATAVHLVDVSEPALETAMRNLAHNRHIRSVRECRAHTTAGDAFAVMRDLADRGEHYDIVVLDPPSFAQSAAAVPAARRAYFRLTQAAIPLVRRGGSLVQASCSSRVDDEEFFQIVHEAASHAGAKLREIRRTGHAIDHPIAFEQGAYLKALFAEVR